MKQILIIIFGLILFLGISSSIVRAQDQEIQGVTCGMAGAEGGADQCCSNKPTELPTFPGLGLLRFAHIPGTDFDDALRELPDRVETTQDNLNNFEEKYARLNACVYGSPDPEGADPSIPGACTCKLSEDAPAIPQVAKMCNDYLKSNEKEHKACLNCATGGGYWSGLGCVPLNAQSFITDYVLKFGIGLAGFFALLCIFYSTIRLQISRGEAEAIQKARENLTSCIIGLLLIIFSVFILELVGVDILGIPFS